MVITVRSWTGQEARALRAARRMSIRGFAEYLGVNERVVSNWEARGTTITPRPVNQQALDTCLSEASHEERSRFADLTEETTEETKDAEGANRPDDFSCPWLSAGEREEADMRRRDVIRALSVMGVAGSFLTPAEAVRRNVEQALLPVPLNDRDISDWETTAADYGRDIGAVPPAVLLGQLMTDLAEAGGLLQTNLTEPARARMLHVVAQLAAVAAVTVVSTGQPHEARRWWRTARRAGEQAGDPDLETFILGQQALLSKYSGYSAQATVALADRALATHPDRVCHGAAEALAARAQGLAVLGRTAEASTALAALLSLFDRLPEPGEHGGASWYYIAEYGIRHTESYVWTQLGQTARAQESQGQALALCPPAKYRGRAYINLHHATTLIKDGDVTAGITHAISTMEALPAEAATDRLVHQIAGAALAALPPSGRDTDAAQHYRSLLSPPALAPPAGTAPHGI